MGATSAALVMVYTLMELQGISIQSLEFCLRARVSSWSLTTSLHRYKKKMAMTTSGVHTRPNFRYSVLLDGTEISLHLPLNLADKS